MNCRNVQWSPKVSNLKRKSAHSMWPTRPPVRNMLWDVGCVGMHTPFRKKTYKKNILIQLLKYEKVPNFIQLSQNLTWDFCWFLFIYLFLPVFAWCDHKIVLFWSAEQFYDHIIIFKGYIYLLDQYSYMSFYVH